MSPSKREASVLKHQRCKIVRAALNASGKLLCNGNNKKLLRLFVHVIFCCAQPAVTELKDEMGAIV